MKKLLTEIEKLKKSKVKQLVDKRIKEFKANKNLFSELCFCLLTANFHAERAIKIQNKLCNKFSVLSQKQLAAKLKKLGHRFPNKRAEFICAARKHKKIKQDRDWLVKNVKGLGYKEASHFLRNIGHTNYALVDFH
ncbi:N-glycosylase, partial [Candidatus Woesearchaeota archaeon]|nr:N-glycosylase [Candidatus Woesearchaeota archaeon]